MDTKPKPVPDKRRGVAMIVVLLIGIVVLVLGLAMIVTSGGLLQSTVDAKQRLRSRYAAESMVELQMAKLDQMKDSLLGGQLDLAAMSVDLGTPNGESGKVAPMKFGDPSGQELITSETFKGMQGHKQSFLVHSTGFAPGGAKTSIDASLYLYQVPIFQFGVFYEGNLEISPGKNMVVRGPVHTNGNAYFRAFDLNINLTFQGPVTVTGNIYHYDRTGSAKMFYASTPSDTVNPAEQTSLQTVNAAVQMVSDRPASVGGVYNIDYKTDSLKLPIGGAEPKKLIEPCDGTEAASLKRQKFACMDHVKQFVNGVSPPAGTLGERVFYDRRELRWVHVWVIDVRAAVALLGTDSILYLSDNIARIDRGPTPTDMIDAFMLTHADTLSRNVSLVSQNPVYLVGSFNTPGSAFCHPAEYTTASTPAGQNYCNVMLVSEALTLLSPSWPSTGSLEQPYTTSGPPWATTLPLRTSTGQYLNGTITINAAILTGNLPTNPAYLPPAVLPMADSWYEDHYEGGGTTRSVSSRI